MATATGTFDDDDDKWLRDLARQYGSEFVGLNGFRIPGALLKKVPAELMFRYNFVPLEETPEGNLAIAIADPRQLMMIDEIKFLLNRRIIIKVSTLKQISNILMRTERSQREEYK